MDIKIDLKTLSINKNNLEEGNFDKYNIDVTIKEMELSESYSKLQFSISFLSEPKNIKIFLDGLVTVKGNEAQIQELLEQTEGNIPIILHRIYDEMFPIIFMMAKTASVPSPSIRLSESHKIMSSPKINTSNDQEQTSQEQTPKEQTPKEQTPKEVISETANVSDDLNDLSLEDLNELYQKLDKEYSDNPSQEIQQKLENVIQAIQKKNSDTE